MMRMMSGAGGAGSGGGPQMSGAEMRSMQTLMEAMTKGDPAVKKQMEGYWKMLDSMAQSSPEEYDQFIKKNMEEMKSMDAEEQKREEVNWTIESTPYFAFSVKPAKIYEHDKTQAPKKDDGGIKLFDFGQSEEIKESFAANPDT